MTEYLSEDQEQYQEHDQNLEQEENDHNQYQNPNQPPINAIKTKKWKGRKISPNKENPLDDMIIGLGEAVVDPLRNIGMTPNMLTTVSFIFGIMSLYFLVLDNIAMFGVCFMLSYYFDCLDGTMARKYSMESKFGDIYDHTSDLTVLLGVICITFAKFHKHMTLTHALILGFFFVMCHAHAGCQQRQYEKIKSDKYTEDEFLDSCKNLCPEPEYIYMTKYFGFGTLIVVSLMYVMYLDLIENKPS
jgi:phosphatidylglycerophosphate synthase